MEKRVERGARGLNDLGEDLLMQAIPSYAGFGFHRERERPTRPRPEEEER